MLFDKRATSLANCDTTQKGKKTKTVNCDYVKEIFAIIHNMFYENRAKPLAEELAYPEKCVQIAFPELTGKNK